MINNTIEKQIINIIRKYSEGKMTDTQKTSCAPSLVIKAMHKEVIMKCFFFTELRKISRVAASSVGQYTTK